MKSRLLSFAACCLLGSGAYADDLIPVRLYVEGAYCAGCAEVLTKSLKEAGVKELSKIAPNRGRGYVIVGGSVPGGKLGAVAEAINQAMTPHRKQAEPNVALELFAALDEKSAPTALAALAAIKGVDAKRSQADVRRGVLSVRLAGDATLTVDSLLASLKQAGIAARVDVGPPPKPAEPAKPEAKP